jgi:hypothetical protein
MEKNLLPKQHCNLGAATPIRLLIPSCKSLCYYARNRSSDEPWHSHSIAICWHWNAKQTSSPQQETKNHVDTSVTARAQFEIHSTAKRRRPQPSRKRTNFSARRNLRVSKKTMFLANPNIQIASWLCLSQCELATVTKHNRIAIHTCRTRIRDAPVPMHQLQTCMA